MELFVPMRVVSNGSGSEVLLTLLQSPGMSDAQYGTDTQLVTQDLATLKQVMERGTGGKHGRKTT